MKIDGKSIMARYQPVGEVESPIGTLLIYGISGHGQSEVMRDTGTPFEKISPNEFTRRLLPFIVHKASDVPEGRDKPDKPTLTDAEIDRLPDAIVEDILRQYIADNEYLYKKPITKMATNVAGERVATLSYGDVEYPKKDGESNAQYLHRLFVLGAEKLKRQLAQMSKNFSSNITGSILRTHQLGTALQKTMADLRGSTLQKAVADLRNSTLQGSMESLSKPMIPVPRVDYEKLANNAHEARWAPFNAVNERLERLIAAMTTSGEFMFQANQTQTQIASSIKASGDDARRAGRSAFWMTIIIIILTLIGLWMQWTQRQMVDQPTIQTLRQRVTQLETQLQRQNQAVTPHQEGQ